MKKHRTREEIEASISESLDGSNSLAADSAHLQVGILEVLLDIRDLLQAKNKDL
jgi:hypothetical protein